MDIDESRENHTLASVRGFLAPRWGAYALSGNDPGLRSQRSLNPG
jgi:hypothetical protein